MPNADGQFWSTGDLLLVRKQPRNGFGLVEFPITFLKRMERNGNDAIGQLETGPGELAEPVFHQWFEKIRLFVFESMNHITNHSTCSEQSPCPVKMPWSLPAGNAFEIRRSMIFSGQPAALADGGIDGNGLALTWAADESIRGIRQAIAANLASFSVCHGGG